MKGTTAKRRLAGWAFVAGVIGSLYGPGAANAEQWYFAGARAQAMGGAGVAVVDDSLASYWNPAALARKKGWDIQIPATAGGSIEQEALSSLGQVVDAANAADDALGRLADGDPLSQSDVEDLLALVDSLPSLGQDGQSFQGGLQVGLMGRYNRFYFGALSNTAANFQPIFELDPNGIRIDTSATPADFITSLLAEIPGGMRSQPSPAGQDLGQEISMASPVWSEADIGHLLWIGEQAGLDYTDEGTRDAITQVANATGVSGAEIVVDNASGAFVRGLSTQEFGVGYALPVPMPFFDALDEKVSIGAQLKYMMGVTFTKGVDYDDIDDLGDVFRDALDDVTISHNVGLDLGVLYEPADWLRIGLTARNVNSPEFKAVNGPDLAVNAQVRAGIAVLPLKNWILAFDADLTENDAIGLPDFRSRLISLGTEYRIPLGKHFDLALRAGGYTNVVEGVNGDWGITAGLGVRMWDFHLDLGGGLSPEFQDFASSIEGSSLPTRVQAGVTLKWEHRF